LIYRIIGSICLKYIKDQKTKQSIPFEESHDHQAEQNNETQAHQTLYDAIKKLNELDRLTIMIVLDGLLYDKIAEVVGISGGALYLKIHRSKKNKKNIKS